MGKKSRRRAKPAKAERVPFVARTFEGLPGECDWIALREIVPAATAPVALREDIADGRSLRVCSLLPSASAGLVRPDGEIWLGLQVQHNFGDISRDLAAIVEQGLEAEPGTLLSLVDPPGPGRRLQDIVAAGATFDVQVHEGFDYWVSDAEDPTGAVAASLEDANAAAAPTVRLEGVDAAYWTQMGDRRYLRWVMPRSENNLLDGLARLRAAGDDRLGPDTRLIGSFRAHGLLVPVWEMDVPQEAADLEKPAQELQSRLDDAMGETADLTTEQRSARSALTNRQLTIR